jgi:pyruvate/oxaloacetate carboxyltransferase
MTRRINFIDTSLRDGHQSLLATRMSTEQCMRVLPLLKQSGYTILELWGGATLDASIRFTGDDPFQRLDTFRQCLGPAPDRCVKPTSERISIRSLCRGQNLFGYAPYHDSVVVAFIKEAVRSGNDRIRIFDALNDPRNLTTAIMATKTFNGHAECALSYTTSPVHDTSHFLAFAEKVIDNGADSIAIKDMAGLLHPADCFELVDALKQSFPDTEISLHAHCTNGLANATYIAGMIAGVHNIDTGHGPMAGGTAQPPAELMRFAAHALGLETNLTTTHFAEIDDKLRTIRRELKDTDKDPEHLGGPWPEEPDEQLKQKISTACDLIATRERGRIDQAIEILEDDIMVAHGYSPTDRAQLDAQIPGGMISNLHSQLKDQGKLDLMPRILEEVPKVRAEAGYVPLVTPTSQIVGTQAAMNIMTGDRYKVISNEFKNMVLGKYGKLPGPADNHLLHQCAPDGKTFDERPANYAQRPNPANAAKATDGAVRTNRDLLLYTLFPAPAEKFLKQRRTTEQTAAGS